jgi:hypothetical protein
VSRVLDAVRRLRLVTEQQIDAAKTLRGAELASLSQERADALFDLRVILAEEGVPAGVADGTPLYTEVYELKMAERRLSSLAQTVLDRLARLDAAAMAPVYGRSGHLP